MQRICLFGGTFNPVHNGHVALAKSVYRQFELDQMILMPSYISPHKCPDILDAAHRIQMVQMSISHLEGSISVSNYEIENETVSYTYQTLAHYRSLYPDAALFFLTGTDIFATIETWKNWQELFDYANFIVVNRKEKSYEDMVKEIPESLVGRIHKGSTAETLSGSIYFYEMDEIPVSSTEIRQCLSQQNKNDFLPETVYKYIIENKLYGSINV